MFFCQYYFLLFFILITFEYSNGQVYRKFFRKDYTFIDITQSFYKIHTLAKTWQDAVKTCSMEGATLFYAHDKAELEAVVKFWNETTRYQWVYVGISDLTVEGIFETVDGLPIIDVFYNWEINEPNNVNGGEDCVVMTKNGYSMNDVRCDEKIPFICKKTLKSLTWNDDCDIPYKDYVYNENFNKCYKFNVKPMNWVDAYTLCAAEQSHLAVIASQDEADYLVELTENTPKDIKNNDFLAGSVLLGFQNRNQDGWTTVKGTSLEDSGYSQWGNQQPDGGELCGSMFYNGRLNDISCNTKFFFICEHEIEIILHDGYKK